MPAPDLATADRPRLAIPWGQGPPLVLAPPVDWPEPEVFDPDREGAIDGYPATLEAALDRPVGIGRLETLVGAGSTVAIVVDDPSRWTPVKEALPIVLRRLHGAGVRTEDLTISVGVGRHHAVDDEAMRRRVGEEVAGRYRCFSPPLDENDRYDDLGTTDDGIPVRVFRPVAEADLRILIGSVLPHLQAGFGGGYKLIFPGTSHRSTLGAIHRQGLVSGDAGRLLGSAAVENPMRRAIRGAAARLGPCVSISHLIGGPGQVFGVTSGHPDAVQDGLAVEVARRYRAPASGPADLVLAGNAPWPGDPMQSFKALLNHRAACRSGGVLVGCFWVDPVEIDRSFPVGWLRLIAGTGAIGGAAIRRLLTVADRAVAASGSASTFMVRWARELVVDRAVLVYAPPLRERLGPRLGPVRLFADQEELWRSAAEILAREGVTAPRVRAFPMGGLSYCPAVGVSGP